MTVEQLKAQVEAKKVAKQAEINQMVETIKLNHELVKLDSPLYTIRELQAKDNATLDAYITVVQEEYAKEDRKLSQTFGYGIIPNKILTLLKAIQYSKADSKQHLLLLTGLDEQTVEDTLDAFGNTAYFSKLSIEVMPSIPMNIPKVKEFLKLVATDLGLVSDLDLSKFNQSNVDYQYTQAQDKADELLDNTREYITTAVAYNE